ncbi:MAG: CsbD family protein [Bacteroidota bacterium]
MKTPTEQQVSGSWKQFKGKVQEAWGVLTEDEIDEVEGQRDQLEGRLEEKTGETREAIRRRIDQLAQDVKYSF